jgi:hypothetical protein
MPEPHLRASDSDRAAVATALGEHMAAGRLTLAEYEERLTHVYETKTLGGLATLTADLPPLTPPRPATAGSTSAVPTGAGSTRAGTPMRPHACAGPWEAAGDSAWRSWLTTALIVLAVWGVTSLATGTALFFWPMWVIGPWGAVLLSRTLSGRDADRNRRRDRSRHRDTGEVEQIRA